MRILAPLKSLSTIVVQIFFISFFSLIAIQAFSAAAPEVEWEKTFGGSGYEQGYFAQQTTDGGYIIVGTSLIKTDGQGNVLWEKPCSGECVQQTSDGGYIVAGGRNGMVLTKLDASGTKEWEQVFQEDGEGWGHCVRQTLDGGYIIGGDGGDPGTGSFLVKTDADGNEEWRQVTTGSWCALGYDSVQQTSDGGYILSGTACRPSPCDAQLTKIDAAGNVVWGKMYSAGLYTAHGYCAQQTSDGGYVLVGKAKHRDVDRYDVYLIKTDASGSVQWERTIGGDDGDTGYSIVQTVAGYIIVGATTSYGAGGEDVYLLKTDVQGTVLWERTIGGTGNDSCHCIQQTVDGGYVVVGVTRSYGAGNGDVYLIKIHPEGGIGNNPPIANAGPDQSLTDTDGNGSEDVALDGSGSYDPDGTIVSWVWTENGGQIATGETPTVTLAVGTHTITLTVTDDDGATDTDSVEIVVVSPEPSHTVSTPDTPSGPGSGQVGESLTFSTGGSACSQGHSVQYRFDWGNGSYSDWSSSPSASHSYSSVDTYQVRAQARCASDTSVVSSWSSNKTVTISTAPPAHTVSTPNTPSGPSSGQVGESLPFVTGGAACSQGHPVQYKFDWGNGNYSNWSSSTSASYAYPATGTYQVRAQARCASVTSITSGWSATKTVNIGETPLPENQQPNPPTNVAQLRPTDSEIPVGGTVETNSVVFKATVTDPDGDMVRLKVELRRLDEFGGNFDETKAGFKESDLVSSGTITTCTAYGLIDDSYHWRARAVDEHGRASDWVQFGNNNISEADFTIASASVRLPVLLVHGFQLTRGYDPGELWREMTDVLSNGGLTVYISDYGKRGATWDDIRSYTAVLAGEIEAIKMSENVEQVDVVAHSMGGLVARAYIESADFASYISQPGFRDYGFSYEGDVRKLIMLGTPNHGALRSWLATLVSGAESAREMHPGSDFLNILNHGCPHCGGEDEIVAGVEYVVFAGEECNECPEYSISPPTPGLSLMQATSIEAQFSCLKECRARGKAWKGDDSRVSMELARLENASLHACIPADHTALRTQQEICEAVRAKLLSQPVPSVIWLSDVIQFACPVHVTVTDQYGRRTNDSGTDEIPGVSVTKHKESDQITIYLNPNLVYDVYIEAYENGKFTLVELLQTQNEEFMVNLFEDVPVVVGTEAYLTVIPSETVRLLEIDSDGDGTIDEETEAILIGEEEDGVPDEGSAVVVGPNPVSSEGCVFWLDLPEDLSQCKLLLFGISGRLLFETTVDPEDTRFPSSGTWNPVDQNGVPLANGPYVYVLIADGKVIGRGKMVIQR